MLTYDFLLKRMAGSVALLALAATGATAAPDVVITDAKIVAGQLVIAGNTATPRMKLRLDGKSGAGFNVVSKADKSFSFGVVYLPKDCIVSVQKLSLSFKVASSTDLVVANCIPIHISPRGDWSNTESYEMLDLVAHGGSSWLAKRDNLNTEPSKSADWQLFAQGESDRAPGDEQSTAQAEAADPDVDATPEDARVAKKSARRDPPSGPAGGDLAGTYPDPTIRVGAVVTNRIANNAVRANKIFPGAVETDKIADGAVNSAKVLDESLESSDLATNSVNATEIADGAIDSGEIFDNSLFDHDLAANSVGNSELQDNAVASANIVNSSITGADVANNSITTADIDGTTINGEVNLQNVPNGRCVQVNFNVPGSTVGEAVVIAMNGTVQNGIILYPQRVRSNGTVQANICNFTGTTMTPIVDLPVRIITFN